MNHDSESLATVLGAQIELMPDNGSRYDLEILRFNDNRLRYELHLLPNNDTAQLAIDPSEPIQPCPMLEFSFCCTDIVIGKSAYDIDANEIAVRFYEGEVSPAGQRLTMTWLPEGYWHIWANANSTPYPENGG